MVNVNSPIDISLEAALELDELKQGFREDAPALRSLFDLLRTPAPAFDSSENGISMLADVRSYALFKESLGQVRPKLKVGDFRELKTVMETYLSDLERGVSDRDQEKIEEAKRFCAIFNTSLLARQMTEIYSRRERSDSRYVSHEFAS